MIYFFVLLLRIVAYLEGTQKIAAFAVVFAIISFSTIKRAKLIGIRNIPKPHFIVIAVSVLIAVHSLIIGALLVRDVAVLLTYWIWFVFLMAYFKNKTLRQCLHYTLITFLIFNIANYVFFELYFSDQKRGINTLLAIFGIHGYRIYFPLSSGANVYTFQVAVNAILALYFVRTSRNKIGYLIIYWFYIFIMFLADSRLILLFTILFSFLYWYSLKSIVYVMKRYWYIIIGLLLLAIYLFYTTSWFDSIKRPGEIKGEVLNRLDIWRIAFDVTFDDMRFIYGHGLNGLENNIPSAIRVAFEDERLQTSHNFFFQNIVDFGFIGFAIILFLIYRILKMTLKIRIKIISILMIMFLFIGVTESIPSFYSFDATVFFITLVAIIIITYEREVFGPTADNNKLSQKTD